MNEFARRVWTFTVVPVALVAVVAVVLYEKKPGAMGLPCRPIEKPYGAASGKDSPVEVVGGSMEFLTEPGRSVQPVPYNSAPLTYQFITDDSSIITWEQLQQEPNVTLPTSSQTASNPPQLTTSDNWQIYLSNTKSDGTTTVANAAKICSDPTCNAAGDRRFFYVLLGTNELLPAATKSATSRRFHDEGNCATSHKEDSRCDRIFDVKITYVPNTGGSTVTVGGYCSSKQVTGTSPNPDGLCRLGIGTPQ